MLPSSPVFEHSAGCGRLLAAPKWRRPQTGPPRPAVPPAGRRLVEGMEDSITRSHRGQTAWQPISQRQVFLLQRLLPSQVAIVLHPGESWFPNPNPISMFCLGWSRPDEWLRPILDEFQNKLPVHDLEATRLWRPPTPPHANRNRGPAVDTSV